MTLATCPISFVHPADAHPCARPSELAASIDDLHHALRQCQRRLGTVAEAPDDLDHARALAHAINNRLQREYLLAAVMRGAA